MSEPGSSRDPYAPAPAHTPGLRSRAGNNMTRSRAGILAGAAHCLVRFGSRRTTMGDIAREGGVAKATLYNHFRSKPEVYAALVADEVGELLAAVTSVEEPAGSTAAVVAMAACAALALAEHPVVRALAVAEPEVLAGLLLPGESPVWGHVTEVVTERVSLALAAGALHPRRDPAAVVETLLRWVLSHATWPAGESSIRAGAYALVHGLAGEPAGHVRAGEPAGTPTAAWPDSGQAAG